MIHRRAFNTYFLSLLFCPLLALWLGAEPSSTNAPAATPKKDKKHKKETSTIRIHLEVPRTDSKNSTEIPVLRGTSMVVNVEKEPFLSEAYLSEAKLIETPGGVEIELQFDNQGRTALENYSAANRGKRLAIYSDFDKDHRWLAAPVINRIFSNGVLRFSPDATRDEADRIVRGLNRVAEVRKKKDQL